MEIKIWGLLENNLSLRTSAHTGVAIPRIFKQFGNKTKLFPFNRGGCHTSDIGHWFAATCFSNSPHFLLSFHFFLPFVPQKGIHQLFHLGFFAVENPVDIAFLFGGCLAVELYELCLRGGEL